MVIDDTAVTPQYVHRITAERELPIIKRIAIGSVRNKLLLILPGALLLSQLVPWLLTLLLMLGATNCAEAPKGAQRHRRPRPRRRAAGRRTRAGGRGDGIDFILSGAEITKNVSVLA